MSERQSPSFSHVTFVPSFNQFLDLDIPLYGATPPPLNMSYDYLTSNVMAPPDHSGFIDLTTDPSPPTASGFPPVFRAATHRREEPSRKRRRVDHDFSGGLNVLSQPSARHIDEVDLTKVDDDAGLEKLQEEHRLRREEELQRQHEQQQEQKQAESIRSLHEQSRKPIRLSDLQCVVCMENMKNITATHCGHLFCHTCIMEALIAGENQGPDPGKGPSRCPVCRKKVVRGKDGKDNNQVIPLELKLRIKSAVAKGKERAVNNLACP